MIKLNPYENAALPGIIPAAGYGPGSGPGTRFMTRPGKGGFPDFKKSILLPGEETL
jgi:hypothetical protein